MCAWESQKYTRNTHDDRLLPRGSRSLSCGSIIKPSIPRKETASHSHTSVLQRRSRCFPCSRALQRKPRREEERGRSGGQSERKSGHTADARKRLETVRERGCEPNSCGVPESQNEEELLPRHRCLDTSVSPESSPPG